MKVLLSSDHHHDPFPQFAKTLSDGMSSRLLEGIEAERALAVEAKRRGCQLHVRDGDLFHKKNIIDAVAHSEVARILSSSGMEEWLLKGNHDLAAGGLRHSLESFGVLGSSITVFDEPRSVAIDDGCVAHFVPHMEDGAKFKAAVDALRPVPSKMNLLFGHTAINAAKNGSEFRLPYTLDIFDIRPNDFDQIFLGHYHEPQDLAPNARYLGSLLQRSFSDVGSKRRALVLDTVTGALEEIAVPGPEFVKVWIHDEADELELHGTDFSNAYVKAICTDVKVTKKNIEKAIRECRGLVPTWEAPQQERVAPGEGGGAASVAGGKVEATWTDHLSAWIARSGTTLDKAMLLELGTQMMAQGLESPG
jgi:hypothetical protein